MLGMTGDADVLRFDGVSRRFGDFAAVDNVSFGLRRGEVLTLLGPSGCGKTTTLRMTIGLERTDAGLIMYRGRTVDSRAERIFVPPDKRAMGMVFQSYAIWPHMNVAENVAFPLRAAGAKRETVDAKVRAFLEIVGLAGFETRSGMQLSGGQQQRVAVARGLIGEPDVLLMDEPFSNLDARLRDQMRIEIKLLQRRLGTSILFVTHDQTEALALSDRIAVMRAGRIEQIGTPQELYDRPATPFVRDFLGQTIQLDGETVDPIPGLSCCVRLAGDTKLEAGGLDHRRSHVAGRRCRISIRPEAVEIGNATIGEPNTLAVTIDTLLFLGAHYEAVVKLPDGSKTVLSLPRSRSWQEGETTTLHLPAAALQLWDGEGQA